MENIDNYFFLWCIPAHKNEIDNYREKKSHFKNDFTEINQGDMPFSVKIKNVKTFEHLNNSNIIVFD